MVMGSFCRSDQEKGSRSNSCKNNGYQYTVFNGFIVHNCVELFHTPDFGVQQSGFHRLLIKNLGAVILRDIKLVYMSKQNSVVFLLFSPSEKGAQLVLNQPFRSIPANEILSRRWFR